MTRKSDTKQGWETLDTVMKALIPAAILVLGTAMINLYADVKVLQAEQKSMIKLEQALEKNTVSLNEIRILLAKKLQ
jgi:uncharacterized protein YbcI